VGAGIRDPYPSGSKSALVDQYIHAAFKDYSVRDLTIARAMPALDWWRPGVFVNKEPWMNAVLIKFSCNAKNGFGGYVGLQKRAIVIPVHGPSHTSFSTRKAERMGHATEVR
jgi:hypothetical protein